MKKIFTFLFSFLLLFSSMLFTSGCDSNSNLNLNTNVDMSERLISINETVSTDNLAESVAPAIVGILSSNSTSDSVGSGVCVASGGYVITNAHVVSSPETITLYLYDGSTISATQIFTDTSLDISILKAQKSLPYLQLCDTDNVKLGEEVLAVGTPISLLLKHSFTKGIVSAMNRTLKVSSSSGDCYMQDLIQHDASLNPGNSGGPLLNSNGEVIGINTLKISSGEGIGFAIPTKSFASLLDSYITTINYETPYLGMFGYDAEIANYYEYTSLTEGVFVVDIANNSPLSSVGITSGDVITKFNDVEVKNILDLRNELFKCAKGSTVSIEYVKDGKTYVVDVVLEKHPVNNISSDIYLMAQVNEE